MDASKVPRSLLVKELSNKSKKHLATNFLQNKPSQCIYLVLQKAVITDKEPDYEYFEWCEDNINPYKLKDLRKFQKAVQDVLDNEEPASVKAMSLIGLLDNYMSIVVEDYSELHGEERAEILQAEAVQFVLAFFPEEVNLRPLRYEDYEDWGNDGLFLPPFADGDDEDDDYDDSFQTHSFDDDFEEEDDDYDDGDWDEEEGWGPA